MLNIHQSQIYFKRRVDLTWEERIQWDTGLRYLAWALRYIAASLTDMKKIEKGAGFVGEN